MSEERMTSTEKSLHRSLISRRGKAEKQKVEAMVSELIANGDAELERQFSIEDLNLKRIADYCEAQIEQLDAQVNAQFDALGVSKELRGRVVFGYRAGGYRDSEHRAELRRKVRVEAEAWRQRRKADIEAWELEALTELAQASITSETAQRLLESLPEVTKSLPVVDGLVAEVELQPIGVIESNREAKRLAVIGALQLDPSRSDREVGRLLGVDHKTVAKVRGEIAIDGEEIPTDDGEIPIDVARTEGSL